MNSKALFKNNLSEIRLTYSAELVWRLWFLHLISDLSVEPVAELAAVLAEAVEQEQQHLSMHLFAAVHTESKI